MGDKRTLVGHLGNWGIATSSITALWLKACEAMLFGGLRTSPEKALDPKRLPAEDILARLHSALCSEINLASLPSPKVSLEENDPSLKRLGRIILSSWTEVVRSGSARRPDVLAITCQYLANPDAPHTLDVVRFVISLTLRSLYGVPYSNDALRDLRKAYDDLRSRFRRTQRRRITKSSNQYENLIIDVLCMHGWISRSLTPAENLFAHYDGFQKYPLGVTPERHRRYAEGAGSDVRWPELSGEMPDFGTIVNLLYTQPTAVRGLDDVTGGLISSVPGPDAAWRGGLVNLIAGPPGSGKTSLCISITSRMAQLGSSVRYIGTEEEIQGIEAKRTALAESSTTAFWVDAGSSVTPASEDFSVLDGHGFSDLLEFSSLLEDEFAQANDAPQPHNVDSSSIAELYLVFPRVVVIDSMTALLQQRTSRASESSDNRSVHSEALHRRTLGHVLNRFRELGVCVFLVGGAEDTDDEGLAYLVDNIFSLDVENDASGSHPIRTLHVRKTRLQTSHRGRHVVHLSRREGCAVSPSLHAVLRSVKGRTVVSPDPDEAAVLWSEEPSEQRQIPLPGIGDRHLDPIALRSHSQVLIYGRGSSGKARLGLSIAFEPRLPRLPKESWRAHVAGHADQRRSLEPMEAAYLTWARVLIVSFLYGRQYYEDVALDLLNRRYRLRKGAAETCVADQVSILAFYPGFIDAETVVSLVRQQLLAARLEGHPFSAVLIDGVHNLLVQFPVLEQQTLLWPTLSRIFRTEGLEVITTFTFFQIAHLSSRVYSGKSSSRDVSEHANTVDLEPSASQQLFFHLLVSSADYSFLAERPAITSDKIGRNWIRVKLASSLEGYARHPDEYWWDPGDFSYKQDV